MSAFRKFIALSWGDKLLLAEAWLYLGLARAALLTIPFKYVSRMLGRQQLPAERALPASPPPAVARRIGWALEIMSRHTPWESACLSQSMAGKFMLRRRGLASLLCLGLKKDEAGQLTAHAWLQAGNEVLLGGTGHETFTFLSGFGER